MGVQVLDDMVVVPDWEMGACQNRAERVGSDHVLGARDLAEACWGSAEAVEGLVHVPFSRGVEECKLVTNLQALWSSDDGLGAHVEDERWLARMVNVDEIRIEVHVRINTHLDSGISRLVSGGAWWEVQLGEDLELRSQVSTASPEMMETNGARS